MKNICNNGFTLVELLAVIIILSLLALIASTAVTKLVADTKSDLSGTQITLIKSAAESWGADNLSLLPNANECKYLTLGDLKESGLMDQKIVDPKTNEEMSDELKIKITGTLNKFNKLVINYEVNPDSVDGCSEAAVVIPDPVSFQDDEWATIVANVKAGNTGPYKVGDTKQVDLGELGTHTLRIANATTSSECNTSGFSQTACGFVLEFTDVIAKHTMNPTVTNVGGWEAAELRTYVNTTVYNSLPKALKDGIIDTYVVSSHGSTEGENNFITTDKLYLLSTKEVWGKVDSINKETAESVTRQLDYYKNSGVTAQNYSGALKKYGESGANWLLRSAISAYANRFYYVANTGDWDDRYTISIDGVSPAFRISK